MCLGLILCCERLSDEYILGQKSASLPISSSFVRPRAQLFLTCSDSALDLLILETLSIPCRTQKMPCTWLGR